MYYLLTTDFGEPKCYEKAMQVETRKKWEQGLDEKMDSLVRNQTSDLVDQVAGKITLHNKWVYRFKEEDGGNNQYNARLVVKGFAQN